MTLTYYNKTFSIILLFKLCAYILRLKLNSIFKKEASDNYKETNLGSR